jgi:hypothetical protein
VKKVISILILFALLIPNTAVARIGVGVGTGKIQVEDELKPGIIYELPQLTVINTGDEPSDYEVAISYHEQQPELQPPLDWFVFSPQNFSLEPGKVQVVEVRLDLPLRIEPGDYFAYLEARPLKKAQSGETSIGVAAAAKLYFTVIPGSFLEGVYFKIISLWNLYSPWPQRLIGGVVAITLLFLFKRFFNIEINLKKPSRKTGQRNPNVSEGEEKNKDRDI